MLDCTVSAAASFTVQSQVLSRLPLWSAGVSQYVYDGVVCASAYRQEASHVLYSVRPTVKKYVFLES